MAETELVVVTGANGFVGKWTTVSALRAGYAVRGTVRSAAKAAAVRAAVAAELGEDGLSRLEVVETDLLNDAGWAEAMQGASAVLHTATIVLATEPKDPSVVVRPAIEGTARVLRFARDGGITRVVITSSIATIGYGHGQRRGKRDYTEEDFTNLLAMPWSWSYCTGKTLAERAAWEFAKEHGMALTTIHPGMILGPALDADASVSLIGVTGLLDGSTPALPNMGFCVIDVRDVADMHIAALQKPEAIGQRYLATGRYLWFREVAEMLKTAYPNANIKVQIIPDWFMGILARFWPAIRQVIDDVGNEKHYDGSKGQALLGRAYISAEDAVLSAAESAYRYGLVRRKGQPQSPGPSA